MKKYMSLVLFAHSVFALPFAFIGFFLAVQTTDHTFSLTKFLLMLVCMVAARNAAMAFNRYLDRDIDALNPRTAIRDIPAGKISARHALLFTVVNCFIFILATFFINNLCFYLSPVALFVVLFYSYTKRFTPLCHLVLGVGLGLAPIGAYLVVTNSFHIVPVFYGIAVMCWSGGFDIIYALQDMDFDREHGLSSIPAFFGGKTALHISEGLHVLSFLFILLPAFYMTVGWLYYIGVIFYGFLLIYQHRIVSPTDLSRVDRAFMTTNGVASVIFAVFYLLDIAFIV
ncbi:putative 4-hydroxybenzoate polyprenyltransferase [Sphingobacterium sp. UT-1RO-CII-1]|uniref:UbiA-like polyprenyltransferase n=1 Tax=Sphingobacterium sp. UT-1RO-CII-1 TaxID=2995225 RepID=UPI00227D61C7|nr:UbiA-like polyprenyltransferase [Sphingobacterium sp. UT-1RO-CII-1]MCY4781380.1 putative 4-hydroxybenzoate polyprenyltransferase [Sphingobacterium sp. UT-1RO-CII-1]